MKRVENFDEGIMPFKNMSWPIEYVAGFGSTNSSLDLQREQTCFGSPSGQNNLTSHINSRKKNNMENETNTTQHKKNDKISNILHERTYDEIVTENDYLGRRVVELLELVEKMEKEKKKMEELSDLDEGWICDLIAERDEQRESNKRCMKQLEECRQKIICMENERAFAGTGETLEETSDAKEREKKCFGKRG